MSVVFAAGLDDSVDYFVSKMDTVNGHACLPRSMATNLPVIRIERE